MGRLVRYVPRNVIRRGALYNPRVRLIRTGIAAGRFAYRNRRSIRTLGRLGRTAFRGYAARRRSYARRAGPSIRAKSDVRGHWVPSATGTNTLNQKTLYSHEVQFPALSPGEVGGRKSSVLYVRGIKLCLYLINEQSYPIEVHMAIVQFKDKNAVTTSEQQIDFFRETTSVTTRSANFVDWATSSGYDAIYSCNPMNPEKFNIITHQKFLLDEKQANYTYKMGPNFTKHDKYYPIKRNVAMHDSTTTNPERPFFILLWHMSANPEEHDAVSAKPIKYMYKYQTYHKSVI